MLAHIHQIRSRQLSTIKGQMFEHDARALNKIIGPITNSRQGNKTCPNTRAKIKQKHM